jgi:hypothetical protein
MVSFQSIVLLESMIKKRDFEDSFCISEATSLKNETKVFEHEWFSDFKLVKK